MLRALIAVTIVALVFASGVATWHVVRTGQLKAALQTTQGERDNWRAAALAAKSRADKLTDLQQSADAAVRELHTKLRTRQPLYTASLAQVRGAPPEDDGAVAPVLRQALEGLP